jgi:hypothetical protein
MCHPVKRILLHENHEIRTPVGIGDRRVDSFEHLALGIDIASLRDVQREHRPDGSAPSKPFRLALLSGHSCRTIRVSSGNGQTSCRAL